jgi:hypothetical protein
LPHFSVTQSARCPAHGRIVDQASPGTVQWVFTRRRTDRRADLADVHRLGDVMVRSIFAMPPVRFGVSSPAARQDFSTSVDLAFSTAFTHRVEADE